MMNTTDLQRQALVALTLVLMLTLPSVVRAFDLDSLLVKSVGGPAAVAIIEKTETLYASGPARVFGQPASYEMFVTVPDQIYVELHMSGISMVQAYDGEVAWTRDQNGMVSRLDGFEKQALLSQLYFQTYAYLVEGRMAGAREYLGIEEDEGRTWHKVAFYPLNQDTVYAYYNVATAYQAISLDNQDNLETITEYSNYQTYAGIVMAETARTSVPGTFMTMDFITDSVALNVPVESTRYQCPESTVDFVFPADQEFVEVPIEYVAGHIYVEVAINGRRLMFLLDSGASSNTFDSAAIEGLGLPIVGQMAVMGISGVQEINLVRTDSTKIGSLTMTSQVGGMLPASGIGDNWSGELPFGGILGYDFLSRFPVLVDYRDRQLTVYDPAQFVAPVGGYPLEFDLHMKVPVVEAELDGWKGRYLVDLGNSFGLLINADYSRRQNLPDKLRNVEDISEMVGGVGGGVEALAATAGSFSFGGIELEDIRLLLLENTLGLTGSVELAGNIGNLVLENTLVLFDYAGQRLIFYDPNRSDL